MKIVIDTNVLIAAFYQPLAGSSFSKEVYDYVVQYEEGIISAFILKEFREKCVKKLKFSTAQTSVYEALLHKKLRIHHLHEKSSLSAHVHLRDPHDRPILELALAVGAAVILTWDKDLLILKSIDQLAILTPRAFWDTLSR